MSPQESREHIEIAWGGRCAHAELRRTNRRVLKISVQPSGHVVVFAPHGEDIETVRHRAMGKGSWVFQELDRIAQRPAVTPLRSFVSGETHLLLGKQYRLSIEASDTGEVSIDGARLRVSMMPVDDAAQCQRLISAFYRSRALSIFRERLDAVVPPFTRRGLQPPDLVIRPMSKRWGSYTPGGRIVLNVDLVRAAPSLIDYVICHELTHAFHPDHGKEWRDLLSTVMPDWESRKAQLEALLR